MTPLLMRLLPATAPLTAVQPAPGLAVRAAPAEQAAQMTGPLWPIAHRLPPLPAPEPRSRLVAAGGAQGADSAADDSAEAADEAVSCGWFESSDDLRQGLAVQEWPQDQWPVAMLYFAELQPSGARLQ